MIDSCELVVEFCDVGFILSAAWYDTLGMKLVVESLIVRHLERFVACGTPCGPPFAFKLMLYQSPTDVYG